jgi:glutathione S-transferase
MKLWSNRFAPSPRRVRMYCAEKGLSYELVEVDIAAREHLAPGYLAVNPVAELPAAEFDDGQRLTESLAICRRLEELHPEPPLFGRDGPERARVNQWIDRLMFRLYVPMSHVFKHTHAFWAGRLTQVPAWGELQRAEVLAELAALDRHLATSPFVAGPAFTMADVVAFTSIDFGKPSGIRVDPAQTHLHAWFEGIRARPSAKA